MLRFHFPGIFGVIGSGGMPESLKSQFCSVSVMGYVFHSIGLAVSGSYISVFGRASLYNDCVEVIAESYFWKVAFKFAEISNENGFT